VSQFGVTKRDVFLLFAGLRKTVDDVAQNMQRAVDVAPLPQPLTLDVGVFDPFAAGQVHNVQLGLFGGYGLILNHLALYQDTEYRVGTGTFCVHLRKGSFAGLLPLQQQPHSAAVGHNLALDESLDENSLLGVLPYLVYPLVRRQLAQSKLTRSKIC